MTPSRAETFTLGQLCKRIGLARTSVLHYESLGLLAPRARSGAGYRLYGPEELERLRTIRRLRDAGLALADIQALLQGPDAAGWSGRPRPAELLERRLLGLCRELERIGEQQRLLARLLAIPDFRDGAQAYDKAAWVALLRRAGFDDAGMRRWHVEFERANPLEHARFLESLGLQSSEVEQIRRRSRRDAKGAVG